MTDTDLRNSAALAEFTNWAASFSAAVKQSLQPFSDAAALVAAQDCATGLRRRRSHAAYCQVRIQGTSALTRKLDALTGHECWVSAQNSQHKFQRQFDSDTAPTRQGAAVGTGAAMPPPVFTGSQLAQTLRRNERQQTTQ